MIIYIELLRIFKLNSYKITERVLFYSSLPNYLIANLHCLTVFLTKYEICARLKCDYLRNKNTTLLTQQMTPLFFLGAPVGSALFKRRISHVAWLILGTLLRNYRRRNKKTDVPLSLSTPSPESIAQTEHIGCGYHGFCIKANTTLPIKAESKWRSYAKELKHKNGALWV